MQNICKLSKNQRNKLQVAHFLEFAKNMSKHSANTIPPTDDGLMLSGYQKKLKTMKKKFFVLYKDTQHNTARLEYYDNERKFKSGLPPKRVIRLRNCFSINRRLDTKHDFVIALSTKDGGFGIVLDTEDEMLRWLEVLISLQRANTDLVEHHMRPQYEHVWQVYVQRKGLAEMKGIIGNYHVCLTPKSLTFVRIGPDKTSDGNNRLEHVEFQLTTIRRCGDSQCYFYMEVGRQSIIGPGELWMETEDPLTAQNMHQMILSAMSTKVDGINMGPMQRKRSSSANEASKPINVLQIKQTYADNKFNNSPNTFSLASLKFGRERCDSLPTRNRTSSECSNHSFTLPTGLFLGGSNARNISLTGGLRSHTYQRHSNSPPINSTNFGCSESEESSISIDEPDDSCGFMSYRFNSRSSEGVIPEENTDDIGGSDTSTKYNDLSSQIDVATMAENYVNMAPVIAKSQQAVNMEHQQVKNVLSPEHQKSPHLDIEFAECAVDHVAKILSPDEETQMERPTRAYSIGSRNEHNRLFKQHMGGMPSSSGAGGGNVYNSNETEYPTGRVRAFSVGSKARIPRCDLQRGVLKPKLLMEQKGYKDKHCHSNSSSNFNISTDVGFLSSSISSGITTTTTNAYKQLYTQRDKKSTSAPLLSIHKSQNSVERMSDLMEIDFSIQKQQQQQVQQQQQQQQKYKITNSTNSRININTTSNIAATTTITTITNMPTTTTTTTAAALLNKTYNSKSVPSTKTTTIHEMPTFTTTTTNVNANMATTYSSSSSNNSKYKLSSSNNSTIRKYNNKMTQQQQQQQQQQITATDNGYLEMKPVGINQQQQQQQLLKKQQYEQLHINQIPKTTTTTTITNNKEQNEGYDVPPDIKINKQPHQQQQHHILMRNINANFTTTVVTATTSNPTININTTVLTNKSQQKQLQENDKIELKADNDNNHNNLEIISLNDENNIKQQQQQQHKQTGIILTSTPEKKYDLILDIEQENIKQQQQQQQQQQKKQECQINKNIVNIQNNDDYANMERKFDAYMKLSENTNTNNNTTATTIASASESTLKLYDNEKHVLTHSLSHDEKHNNQQQQQQHKINRKSCGSTISIAAVTTTTTSSGANINDTSGYEMLQIKNNSDKMRIFTSVGNLKDNNNKIIATTTLTTTTTTTSRPRSTNSTLMHSLSATSNVSLSQPVTPTTTITTMAVINSATSRPSSLNLEPAHELHYASLDWPQCSSQEVKPTTTETATTTTTISNVIETLNNAGGETVVLPSCTSVHNVYAKIDFDHSDSSSSSSKNI